ncbi:MULTISPECIES: ABC transporter permease [unclassified Dehalobacter]|uniref:ABC transporter permease n=1 Tax=unclassified Dehalobacter TaxID=2635733 RepID=UPI000E6BC6BD|nr:MULTISPECIES: ABC transporter permease [unclassified Dehalobacter]RJE47475.1 multidrug ABC transporter permease [Dehalobacter sp. MCB1]TCX48713.1 ABC transporter permease [Dehalobacter sp. 14DCB1]TCX56239.1 ABC transporter permease [Dehalobacter sp. 12DCB1]
MRNILFLVKNTLRVTFRKKGNYIVYLLLPLLGIVFSLGIYSGAKSQPVQIGVIDQDQTALSSYLVQKTAKAGNYTLNPVREAEIKNRLFDQTLAAAVIIPAGYEKSIIAGSPAAIEIISLKGKDITAWLEQSFNLQTQNLKDLAAASNGDHKAFWELFQKYSGNPLQVSAIELQDESVSKGITLTSLGFLLMFVMLGAGLTSHAILNEKRSRTYHRICASPVSTKEYLSANSLSSLIIVTAQTLFIILALQTLFRIETYVPAPLLFLILLLFGLVSIGIGLITTAFSSSSYMAGTLSTLIMTPTCMLGGCFWPVSLMPETMQKIAHFMPQWWALDAIQKIQDGGNMTEILMNIAILIAFTAAFFLIAVYRFARESNVQKFV